MGKYLSLQPYIIWIKMSIKVTNVTKVFGEQRALDHVSFEAKQGEIVGFLGPNGAGKTTMMKIITCLIPPTEGDVTVCGLDIWKDSLELRKKIGYLSEANPLYYDMYVYRHCVDVYRRFPPEARTGQRQDHQRPMIKQ